MPYSTHSDISIALQLPSYDTESQPTAAQVTDIIAMIDGKINSALVSIGVALPVTNADFLQLLKEASINGTTGRVSGIYTKNNDGNFQANFYWSEFKAFLKDIIENSQTYLNMLNPTGNLASVSPSNNVTAGYTSEDELSFKNDVRFP